MDASGQDRSSCIALSCTLLTTALGFEQMSCLLPLALKIFAPWLFIIYVLWFNLYIVQHIFILSLSFERFSLASREV